MRAPPPDSRTMRGRAPGTRAVGPPSLLQMAAHKMSQERKLTRVIETLVTWGLV